MYLIHVYIDLNDRTYILYAITIYNDCCVILIQLGVQVLCWIVYIIIIIIIISTKIYYTRSANCTYVKNNEEGLLFLNFFFYPLLKRTSFIYLQFIPITYVSHHCQSFWSVKRKHLIIFNVYKQYKHTCTTFKNYNFLQKKLHH